MLSPWQGRALRAGLSQRTIARLLGRSEAWVSLAIRARLAGHENGRVPQNLMTIVVLWEQLGPPERHDIFAALGLHRPARQRLVSPAGAPAI